MTDNGDLWLFYHVPKTGGQTLRNHFSERLGPERHVHLGRWDFDSPETTEDHLAAMTPAERERIRVVTGHSVHRGMREHFPGRRCHDVLVVRRPVDRIISHYHFQGAREIRRGREPRNFAEFLAHLGPDPMTKWVARFFGEPRRRFALNRALHGMERCTVVWPVEELDAIIGKVLYAVGLDDEIPPRANRLGDEGQPQPEPDPDLVAQLVEQCVADETVYRAALRHKERTMRNLSDLVRARDSR